MFSAPLQVYIECFYHLLSLLPEAVLLIPSRVRVYTAFGGVSFFVVFVFCFVENKYLWGHLGSIGVWAQFICHGFLWSLCPLIRRLRREGGGRRKPSPIG